MWFELKNDNKEVLTLAQLRTFLKFECAELPDDTPITLNCTIDETSATPCVHVLANEESVDFYSF